MLKKHKLCLDSLDQHRFSGGTSAKWFFVNICGGKQESTPEFVKKRIITQSQKPKNMQPGTTTSKQTKDSMETMSNIKKQLHYCR